MSKNVIPEHCVYCGSAAIAGCKKAKGNGGYHYYALCLTCWKNANGAGQWVSQQGVDMATISAREELLDQAPCGKDLPALFKFS